MVECAYEANWPLGVSSVVRNSDPVLLSRRRWRHPLSQRRTSIRSYDAAGNQTVVNGNGWTYDAENRGVWINDPVAGSTEQIIYDGLGQRVRESWSTGGVRTFVHDIFGNLAAEYSPDAVAASPCQTCYLSADLLGSTRLVTDEKGNVVGRHDYLPYGEEIVLGRGSQWGPDVDPVRQKFTGQQRDTETGVDYFQARYYGSTLERFTSADPANAGADASSPQSWNGYAYVGNNPINGVDPTGMYWGVFDWLGGFLSDVGGWFGGGGSCGSDFCVTGTGIADRNVSTSDAGFIFGGGGGGGNGGGGGRFTATAYGKGNVPTVSAQPAAKLQPGNSCYSLAAGQTPSGNLISWYEGVSAAQAMTSMWAVGVGPTNTSFGPNSVQAQEMAGSPLVAQNIKSFLQTGQSSGWQNFDLSEVWTTGANPTGQFIGSYGWTASRSGGMLTFTITNQTSVDSAFYHPSQRTGGRIPFKWNRSTFRPGANVNQTIAIRVPCGG